ncbi:hypothetical protein [Antarcticirhabdus aurantiaca]|uniref:hypothetical protein n=1 Tax=Antarcticirhabdus aurantiaca TaxID=2606717 RepID=UPI00131BF23F|nr:hypothetical protein [Antarcticirhabdus aurantiaca]
MIESLAILLAWLAFALIGGIVLGRHLRRLRRAHPVVRWAANDDFIRFSPPSRRRRARRGG